jgi:hypothetical protein
MGYHLTLLLKVKQFKLLSKIETTKCQPQRRQFRNVLWSFTKKQKCKQKIPAKILVGEKFTIKIDEWTDILMRRY